MECIGAKEQYRRLILESTLIIPDNALDHCVKNLMGKLPELDEETVNNYLQIIKTSWNRVGVPLVREPAFDIPIVQF